MSKLTIKFNETNIISIPKEWEDWGLFVKTIQKFLVQEKFILKKDLNERTITHKLAEHIKNSFNYYDVDCEYNRMKSKNMSEEYVSKTLGLDAEDIRSSSVKCITVFPDIIVHKRGDNDDNYLAIEVKKKKYANKERVGRGETYGDFDRRKLCAYTRELQYKFGIYLEFDKDTLSKMIFFRDGKECT